MEISAFVDIETEEWENFVCGGITTDGEVVSFYWDEDSLGWALLALEGEVWAWNGGLYDAVWFASWLERRGVKYQCSFAGTRIVGLVVGNLTMRDSVALIPMSLQRASVAIGPAISKETGFDCRCGKQCGGYCRISRDMSPHERATLERYLAVDVITGWGVMIAIFAHAARAGYELSSTVGGSIWRTMKSTLDIGPATWLSGRDYEQARAGYYGGRVFVGRIMAATGHRADLHSAYPDALSRVALPHGDYVSLRGDRAFTALTRERPGIYEASVYVPPSQIPPLPWRSPSGRILYPTGPVRGSWSLHELEYAIGECGVHLHDVHSGIVWGESDVLFDSLMSQIFAIRHEFRDNKALYDWQKWFSNSGTGKFAERPEKERLFCNLDVADIKACDPTDPRHWELGCRWGRCSGRCGAMTPLNFDGNLWLQSYWRLSDCSHVHWAAYLTSFERIKWHRAAMSCDEGRGVIYGDTDSVYSLERLPESLYGDGLGEWGDEGPLYDWVIIAPKTYRYYARRDKSADYQTIARGKGIPHIDAESWEAFRRGDIVTIDRGVMGLRSAARANTEGASLFRRKMIKRSRHGTTSPGDFIGDRRIAGDGVNTRPITVDEQLTREREGG